eukprot:475055_1
MVNDVGCATPTENGALCNAATHREYLLIDDGLFTWSDAQQACQDRFGSDLATIITAEDAKEALRVANTASNQGLNLWIGLNDMQAEGDYVFVQHTECDEADVDCGLVFFDTGEPNDDNTSEDCVCIRLRNVDPTVTYKDMMADKQCALTFPALCNKHRTPDPTSFPTTAPVTANPTAYPTLMTLNPSAAPITSNPSATPSTDPTTSPVLTLDPSMAPVTSNPSANPTASPVSTSDPSVAPVTSNPSTNPSAVPTTSPGATLDPSAAPVTSNPSADPSANPTASPDATSNPSVAPVTSSRRYEIIVPHPPIYGTRYV